MGGIMGIFGQFWDINRKYGGNYGHFWTILGQFPQIWGIIRSFLDNFGTISANMGGNGALLGQFWTQNPKYGGKWGTFRTKMG